MSSRSYYYNKHPYRSRSYSGKKRIYGSAYQPGRTTKYQRYGRTMRLDPGYISVPRELPTRQSQLRQVEELRRAGLIPEQETVNMFKLELDDVSIQDTVKSNDYILGLLTENQAPSGSYVTVISCKNGYPYYTTDSYVYTSPLTYFTFDYDSGTQTMTNIKQRYYQMTFPKGNFPNDTSMTLQEGHIENVVGPTYAANLRPVSFNKANTFKPTTAEALYTIVISQLSN